MSFSLKAQMVEEYDNVVSNNFLIPLPRNPNINEIFDEFLSSIEDEKNKNILQEITECLSNYFESALPLLLLYQNEKKQYDDIEKDKKLIEIYGAEHLLRLLVKLPQLLSLTSTDKQNIDFIFSNVTLLFEYILL